jgi:hypothetical protein
VGQELQGLRHHFPFSLESAHVMKGKIVTCGIKNYVENLKGFVLKQRRLRIRKKSLARHRSNYATARNKEYILVAFNSAFLTYLLRAKN